MSYTTINDLPLLEASEITGYENFLITDEDTTYKLSLNVVNEKILELSANTLQSLTNKVIDDVSNFVHANAIHYVGVAVQDMSKGTPVKIVQNADTDSVYVDIAGSNDIAVGICEDGISTGELGTIMIAGVLSSFDTTSWVENDLLYSSGGVITNVQPTSDDIHFIGYVLNSAVDGKILVSASDPFPDARQMIFNVGESDLTSTNVQDVIIEVDSRIKDIEDIVYAPVDTTIVEYDDPVLGLGETTEVSDGKDRGLEFKYGTTASPIAGFFGLDESTGRFTFIPDSVNTSEVFTGIVGDYSLGNVFQSQLDGVYSTGVGSAVVNASDLWNSASIATANMAGAAQFDILQADANGILSPTKTISSSSGITIDCGTY